MSGLELARRFYVEAVRPIILEACPGVVHSAARIGRGSEVLGFDDRVSQDHDWGPRVEVFFGPSDRDRCAERLAGALSEDLPRRFGGYSTSFGVDEDGVGVLIDVAPGEPVAHRVEILEVAEWSEAMLGFDPRSGIGWFDWLATSSHRLAEVTGGEVFHDGLGDLGRIRTALAYYPRDVWLYVLASQWRRIAQEEAFVGRCGQIGDDLGATVVAARLIRDLMRLCLLMERRYPPYSKWLGTAFGRLDGARFLAPLLTSALRASDTAELQQRLTAAYEAVAEMHNGLGIAGPINARTRPFWNRGYPVILADRFAMAIRHEISSGPLLDLPLIGSVDQFADSTDVLAQAHLARAITTAAVGGQSRRQQHTGAQPAAIGDGCLGLG
jgi:Domain of unknown function (DUF4037)